MTKDNEDALRCADRCHGLSTIDDAYSEEAYRDAAAHLRRLVTENEDKDALLRQALETMEKCLDCIYLPFYEKPYTQTMEALSQHLESKQ